MERNGLRRSGFRGLTVLALVLVLISFPGEAGAFRNLKEGDPAPDFTLKDLAGTPFTLSAEKGKVVILCFFRADQDRSIRALNDLGRIHGVLAEKGLVVFAVTSVTEDLGGIKSLQEKLGVKFPILLDEAKEVYGSYGLFTFPDTGLVDKEGRFVFQVPSYDAGFEATVSDKAKALLGLISEEEFAKSTVKKEIVEVSPEAKAAERDLQMAKTLLSRGFGSKALPKLESAIAQNPALTEARILAGDLYLEEGKVPEARTQFEKVLELSPSSNEGRVGMGAVWLAQGDLAKAEAELQKAVTLNPDPGKALYRLGLVYEKKGESAKALETYRTALEGLLKKAAREKE